MNQIIIVGNVGQDPEIKSFENGSRVCNFAVATTEYWKDKQTGEKKEKTTWHTVETWSAHMIGIIEKYVKKGTKIGVVGSYQSREWQTENGENRRLYYVSMDSMELLSRAPGHTESGRNDDLPY